MTTISRKQIKEAVECLRRGGAVLFPTETAYGLAVDATNQAAVDRLCVLKGRDAQKTFPLIAASISMAKKHARLSRFGLKLAKKYWPGPLTIVVDARPDSGLARGVVRADGTIAVRVSSHRVAHLLTKKLGKPITSTSANTAGKETPYSISETDLRADVILDCGKLPKRKVSTIVKVSENGIEILREGSIRPAV